MSDGNDPITKNHKGALVKKIFRTFFISLTWIGLSFIILGCSVWILISIYTWRGDDIDPMYAVGPIGLSVLFSTCGALAILIFGFIGRNRYFWIAAMTTGIIYIAAIAQAILSTSDTLTSFLKESLRLLWPYAPGFICIILSILFKKFPKAEILKA